MRTIIEEGWKARPKTVKARYMKLFERRENPEYDGTRGIQSE